MLCHAMLCHTAQHKSDDATNRYDSPRRIPQQQHQKNKGRTRKRVIGGWSTPPPVGADARRSLRGYAQSAAFGLKLRQFLTRYRPPAVK